MPKDYSLAVTPANEQRCPENARDDDWTRAFLVRARVGHVATRWDDQPFITPTTFWYDPERREVYFHSNLVGRVRANSERHARVCFEASEFGNSTASKTATGSLAFKGLTDMKAVAAIQRGPVCRQKVIHPVRVFVIAK